MLIPVSDRSDKPNPFCIYHTVAPGMPVRVRVSQLLPDAKQGIGSSSCASAGPEQTSARNSPIRIMHECSLMDFVQLPPTSFTCLIGIDLAGSTPASAKLKNSEFICKIWDLHTMMP